MKPIQHLIVALDMSACDKCLFRFAGYFSDMLKLRRVYFLHVIPESFAYQPPGMRSPQVLSPVASPAGMIREKIQKAVNRHFKTRFWPEIIIEVKEGDPLRAVIEKTEELEADLLLLGKKRCNAGSGITARMIARRVMSSVFFFPEHTRPEFHHILVPVDFSDPSFSALQLACSVWGGQQNTKLSWIHVADPAFDQQQEWPGKLCAVFDRMCASKKVDSPGFNPAIVFNNQRNVAAHILDWAVKNKADLIVMGAKGHADAHELQLGSVAEKLVTLEEDIPVLIVR
ncbi:MAG TPA: universal stress protein [Flavilitoribacter sp.]|nr:universal stress protein [Flavilitoribacter sp.]